MTSKQIFLIRHAESTHNSIAYATSNGEEIDVDPLQWDAHLSEKGFNQAKELANKVEKLNVDLIVVSPLTRAFQTCLESFGKVQPDVTIVVNPICRERLENACDIGSPASKLKSYINETYPKAKVDWSLLVDELWWFIPANKQNQVTASNYKEEFLNDRHSFQEPFEDLAVRCRKVREWLLKLDDQYKNIALIGHSAFLKEFLGANDKMPNCHIEPLVISS